jgi:hypothetical protein
VAYSPAVLQAPVPRRLKDLGLDLRDVTGRGRTVRAQRGHRRAIVAMSRGGGRLAATVTDEQRTDPVKVLGRCPPGAPGAPGGLSPVEGSAPLSIFTPSRDRHLSDPKHSSEGSPRAVTETWPYLHRYIGRPAQAGDLNHDL